MKNVLCYGFKKSLVESTRNKNIKLIQVIDDWDDPEFLPSPENHEMRIKVKDSTNDFFVLSSLMRNQAEDIDLVISPYEYTLVNVSIMAKLLSVDYILPNVAISFRDKIIQKTKLAGAVKLPKYTEYDEAFSFDDLKKLVGTPFVIKPNSGTGTIFTYKITDKKTFLEVKPKLDAMYNRFNTIIVESFVSGTEYYVDGWFSDYKLQQFIVSKYVTPLLNIYNGELTQGISLKKSEHEDLYNEVETILNSVMPTLDLGNSVFHLEFFLNENGEIVFSECAARLGGTLVEEKFKYNFDIDMNLVQLEPEKYKGSFKEISTNTGFSYLPSPTVIIELPSADYLKEKNKDLIAFEYEWECGMGIPDSNASTSSRIGRFIVKGKSEEETFFNLEKVVSDFKKFIIESGGSFEKESSNSRS
ncbi:ATP-grasp domain-containing protein [Senegalia massiliensis]|uniref:ATP-grasp domain-containing protein n=1 Tax=Senegalia massiliensis TaxID=1720316 RepID=UPI0013EEEFD2|nr:ATP-grasp domain-containing protein [Senegalia massiliensis]